VDPADRRCPHLRARTNSSLPPPLLVSRQQTHQHPMVSLARVVRPALLRLHQQHPHLRPRGMGLVHLPKTAPRPRLLDARQLPRDGDRAPRVGCAPPTIESTIQISIVTVPRSWGSNRGSSPRQAAVHHPFDGTAGAEFYRFYATTSHPALLDRTIDRGEQGGHQYPPLAATRGRRGGDAGLVGGEIGARPTTYLQWP
jgi:hypothetical protein